MRFEPGDILKVPIKKDYEVKKDIKTKRAYPEGYIIIPGDELCGVVKGHKQILAERCVHCPDQVGMCKKAAYRRKAKAAREKLVKELQANEKNDDLRMQLYQMPTADQVNENARNLECRCLSCVLDEQPDFQAQKTALEELYERFSREHNIQYRCKFLPKFHPEVNPIERCWGRQKWHVRRYSDGTVATVKRLMKEGMSEHILPLSMIRKFIRLSFAYLLAYQQGLTIVGADKWIRKHRSHRKHSQTMDAALEALYFPPKPVAEPTSPVSLSSVSSEEEGSHGKEVGDVEQAVSTDDVFLDDFLPIIAENPSSAAMRILSPAPGEENPSCNDAMQQEEDEEDNRSESSLEEEVTELRSLFVDNIDIGGGSKDV
eukprot:gene36930-44804_t